MKVLGLTGWSGSGKTTLGAQLIPRLTQRGLRISTLKHAHHAFDVDTPGKDSHRHRLAGASQVLVSSAKRWVLMTELRGATELRFEEALAHLAPCDLVLVEGFKQENFPKIEVHRPSVGKPLLYPEVPGVRAVASDQPLALPEGIDALNLEDLDAIEAWILRFCAWPN